MATFLKTFDGYTAGAPPDDFSWHVIAGSGHTIASGAPGASGQVLQSVSTVNSSGRQFCADEVGSVEDAEIYARFCLTGGTSHLFLFSRLLNTDVDGYAVKIAVGTVDTVTQYALSNNTPGNLSSKASLEILAGVWYRARFSVVGSSIKTKVWGDGASEPEAWTLEKTHTFFAGAGKVGLYGYTSNAADPVYIDTLGIGTGGDAAPMTGSVTRTAAIATVTAPVVCHVAAVHDWTVAVNPARDTKTYQIRLEKPGLDPLVIPAATVSVRSALAGRSSSITVTTPSLDQVDAIAERSIGGVLIFAAGYVVAGRLQVNDVLTLPLTDIRPDEGTTNKSLTLTARGAALPGPPKSVAVSGIEYRSVNGLKRLLRLPVDVNLLPGDTVVTEAASWGVGEIVYALGSGAESMTVTEA